MSRFYFDVIVYGKWAVDEEGMELPDLAAAEQEASASAMAIGVDEFPSHGGNGMVIVEVRDNEGHRLASATATMALQIVRFKRARALETATQTSPSRSVRK
jgi:hypothetical protein